MEKRLVKFETRWTERLNNWNKYKPFAGWYHKNKSHLWRFGGNPKFRLKIFLLGKVPSNYKYSLGKRIRDPQKITENAVITAIYVPLGHENSAKLSLKRMGYKTIKKEKTYLWKAR